jgi:hypothetical protein
VTRRLCRWCGGPLSNSAAHVPTPELRDPGRDAGVWFCLEAGRHVVVPVGWVEDVRTSVRRARSLLRRGGVDPRR